MNLTLSSHRPPYFCEMICDLGSFLKEEDDHLVTMEFTVKR